MQPAANTKRGGDRRVENQPQDRLMKLEGVVEHMIYENTETGYAVFEVDAGGTDVIVAGNVGSVDNGMSVTVYGRMVNHPSYGEQFKAETCEASLPSGERCAMPIDRVDTASRFVIGDSNCCARHKNSSRLRTVG